MTLAVLCAFRKPKKVVSQSLSWEYLPLEEAFCEGFRKSEQSRGHLNTVISLGTVSSKWLDTEVGLCSSVNPMAIFWSLLDT